MVAAKPAFFAKEQAFTLRTVANKTGHFCPEFRLKTPLAPQKRRKNFLDFGFDRQIPDNFGLIWENEPERPKERLGRSASSLFLSDSVTQ